MVKNTLVVAGCVLSIACGSAVRNDAETAAASRGEQNGDAMESGMNKQGIEQDVVVAVADELQKKYPTASAGRIKVGTEQVAERWTAEDGGSDEYREFCLKNFIKDEKELETIFGRIESNIEQIYGHLLEVTRYVNEPIHLDSGPILPIDHMFATLDFNAHLQEDFYKSKIAFLVLLNFKIHTLSEKNDLGRKWTRREWAYARLADLFVARVPSWVKQQITESQSKADTYITQYNIHPHHLLTRDNRRLFPVGPGLISHWGLRDELKAQYAQKDGLERQRMIHQVMEKIIYQEIPQSVIDNPTVDWVVETGQVVPTTVDNKKKTPKSGAKKDVPLNAREPDTRYAMLQAMFQAQKTADAFYPKAPTYIQRKFEWTREIPEEEVVALLKEILSAPVMKDIAELARERLGRSLEPFDIWYDGFSTRGTRSEAELDRIVGAQYPSAEAFQQALPKILQDMGFDKDTSAFLGSKIIVDSARGSGHAWGAERREDNAHLRTRVAKGGMNYKGYNIAIHELGHNVEQVLTLNKIDHYLLNGVPNNAFTEGFAFAFQGKDLKLLGMEQNDPKQKHLYALDTIWNTFEISGVALVDVGIWNWMYEHPDATPQEIKQGILKIAKDVWNEFFSPVFGQKDQALLAIYSHIIDAGMYLPDYPLGFIIQFQMQDIFRKNGLAGEMLRMCRAGSVTPEAWMQHAVGGPISAQSMIQAATEAVAALKN